MGYTPHDYSEAAPAGPHLALVTEKGEVERWLPIGPGNYLYLIEDPNRLDSIFPFILKSVTHKCLTFILKGADGAITEYKYQLVSGKPLNIEALKRMQKNREG